MSPVTLPSSRALLLYACAERSRPYLPILFFRLCLAAEMPPDAGHGKRESAPATISGCYVFLVLKQSWRAFARRGNGRQDRLKTSAAGRTPASASHARMTMTLAGLLSRRQESRAFHFIRSTALWTLPVARCAILYAFSFFFPPLHKVCTNVPMPPFQTASVGHFRCRGKGKDGIRNTNFLATISTLRRLR